MKVNKDKAIGIVGVVGMAAISGLWPAYIVAGVAALCILNLEEEETKPKEDKELTVTKEDK